MQFSDVPFHDDVKNRLRGMVDDDRIPHALLLEGPAGAGKFALARAMVQYLHCENRHAGEPCGKCPACVQHQTFNHPDLCPDPYQDFYPGLHRDLFPLP